MSSPITMDVAEQNYKMHWAKDVIRLAKVQGVKAVGVRNEDLAGVRFERDGVTLHALWLMYDDTPDIYDWSRRVRGIFGE